MDAHAGTAIIDHAARTPLRRRLGRGLNALLGGGPDEHQPAVFAAASASAAAHTDHDVSIELIELNPFQPRRDFDDESLDELAGSIRKHGLLQPLVVRPHDGGYQLVAGERRWRAARKAGLERVPCRVLELDDRHVCEAALEENLKRKDLNPLEKARAFQQYLDSFGCTIEDLSETLSMSRSNVSNYLRLLELPDDVKNALAAERITAGHARALLPLDEQRRIDVCHEIVRHSLSVRQTEQRVREILNDIESAADDAPATEHSDTGGAADSAGPDVIAFPGDADQSLTSHVRSLQEQLRSALGLRIEIQVRGKDAGRVVIAFDSNDEFERIIAHLRRAA